MDGVGARLGRSSARYAPTTVFTGPVRKWKKKWIHGTPLSSGNNHNRTTTNGVNGNGSHLLLFKWIPITASQNNNGTTEIKNDDVSVEETPKRKFKYIPNKRMRYQKKLKMILNQLRRTQIVRSQHLRQMILMINLTSTMCPWKRVRLRRNDLQNDKT